MKPVISTVKRPSSFTIESIIGTERGKSSHFQNDDTPRRLSFGNRDIENRVPLPHQEFLPQLNRLYQDLAISSQVFTQPWGVYPSSMAPGSVSGQGQCSLLAPAPVNPFLFNRPSETTQLHPWLFARQGLSYHLPGCTDPGFLFHPYRKPKRIRTAFSPSQLLKLDDAFDKNHYVVGQERKELATKLGLTETQVKVWFQNRRTKYKRIKAEQDSISPSNRQSEKCVRENSVNDDSDSEDENEIVDVS